MDRKKKDGKEHRVSNTDSPSWDVVQQQREGLGSQGGPEKEPRRTDPEQPDEKADKKVP